MMIRAVHALAVAGIAIFPLSVTMAAPQRDRLWMHFDAADEMLKDDGYTPTKWRQRGELNQGSEARFDITLAGGSSYAVISVCEDNCTDLAMYVSDASGNLIDRSVSPGNRVPLVSLSSAGTYSVRVVMRACSSSPCAFGTKTYRK